jgi:hypothetical protein
MDPVSAWLIAIAVSYAFKRYRESGQAEVAHQRSRYAEELARAHPDWSQSRVDRHARNRARSHWWGQAAQGFPGFWETLREDWGSARAVREEAKLRSWKHRKELRDRIDEARRERERLHEEEWARRQADTDPETSGPDADPSPEPAPAPDPPPEAAAARRPTDAPDIIDAEIVDDGPTPEPDRSTDETTTPPTQDTNRPEQPATAPAESEPAPPQPDRPTRPADAGQPEVVVQPAASPPAPFRPQPEPQGTAATRDPVPPSTEGDTMPPRSPGHVVPRNGTAPAPRNGHAVANGSAGEAWTHGQFESSAASVQAHADAVPPKLESMLSNLRSVDAGRSQVRGVIHAYELIGAFIGETQQMLTESNRRARPVVRAVDGAGGPEEIANMPYYQRV